ncbi:MAG TPA: DedA family protein [Chloroflexota bacterium]|nr:DedA family protein [Chloroflexota bacterium]
MFLGIDLTHLLAVYGYWVVLLVVAAESMGLPVPGETTLLSAAVYAGLSGQLSIALVITAAAAGAILGDNAGYLVGRTVGERVLGRLGRPTGRSGRALVVGRYLFGRHGGKAVFLGRFVAVLRIFAALLAGATKMPWRRFVLYNAAGGLLWASVMGLLGYALGSSVAGPLGIAGVVCAVAVALLVALMLWRNGRRWEREALEALRDDDAREAA